MYRTSSIARKLHGSVEEFIKFRLSDMTMLEADIGIATQSVSQRSARASSFPPTFKHGHLTCNVSEEVNASLIL